jgi:hypothetical protein
MANDVPGVRFHTCWRCTRLVHLLLTMLEQEAVKRGQVLDATRRLDLLSHLRPEQLARLDARRRKLGCATSSSQEDDHE